MSLTCLVCQTLVYRVLQVITPDIDYGEGPVPPTEDWVESELLKTPSGWIEVYQDCIVSGLASHFPCVKEGRACPSATMWSFPPYDRGNDVCSKRPSNLHSNPRLVRPPRRITDQTLVL